MVGTEEAGAHDLATGKASGQRIHGGGGAVSPWKNGLIRVRGGASDFD
jgi:hypothetical protein